MLTEEDKLEIGKIARKNIRLGMFFNDLRMELMSLLNNPDDEKEKYYSWSILAHDYFVDAGSTNMIEDLVEILDSKYNNHEIWKTLEKNFIDLRSVFKMRTSISNAATTEQMGYGIISFFVCFSLMN